MKTLKNIRKYKRGFSLVELMVVLAIMSILSAIAIPSYLSYQKNAREAVVESMLHIVNRTIAFEVARDISLSTLKTSNGFDAVWDEVRSEDRKYFDPPVMSVGPGTRAGEENQQWCVLIAGKSGTDYEEYTGCVSNSTARPNKVLVVGGEEGNCTDFKKVQVYHINGVNSALSCPTGCSNPSHAPNCGNGSSTTYKVTARCTPVRPRCIAY